MCPVLARYNQIGGVVVLSPRGEKFGVNINSYLGQVFAQLILWARNVFSQYFGAFLCAPPPPVPRDLELAGAIGGNVSCMVSISSTHKTIACMSSLRSEITAERVFFMSEVTLRRSSRHSAGGGLAAMSSLARCGLLLGDQDSRECAACEAWVLSLGRVRKMSGIWRLSCVFCSRGEQGLVADMLRDDHSMFR